jgi:hypothetical protein
MLLHSVIARAALLARNNLLINAEIASSGYALLAMTFY